MKAEGRGPSIWDALSHRATNYIVNNYAADVTNNNYYLYKQDIARIAALGVKTYSFTLSWSRILPFGRGPVNEDAIAHYNDVIDTCLEYGITPQVTLYHWDLPLYLQDTYGGWLSEEIVPDFVEYARIAFAAFGERVTHWYTVNEPIVFCGVYPLPAEYFKNATIPDIQQKFFCGHNVLLAHSQAYRLGKSMMPDSLISLKHNGGYKIPLTNSTADAEAVQRAWDFNEGWFSDPTFLTGDYPDSLKGYVSDFLPNFTEEQKRAINGSADFYAHDAYTAHFYFAPDSGIDACVSNASHPLYPTWYAHYILTTKVGLLKFEQCKLQLHLLSRRWWLGHRSLRRCSRALATQGNRLASGIPALHPGHLKTCRRHCNHRVRFCRAWRIQKGNLAGHSV